MDVSSVKSQIKLNSIDSFYIFSGPEWEVQKIYIKQLAKVKNMEVTRIDSISSIYSKLKNKSFVSKPVCYVVRDDKDLIQNEDLQKQLINGLLGDNLLILLITNIDKRTKFYKAYKDKIVIFEPLADSILIKYIQKNLPLSTKFANELIEVCEHDYGRILLEIDKISRFLNSSEYLKPDVLNADDAFVKLLSDGTIYRPACDSIFNFVDEILQRKNIDKIYDLLEQCYEVGEATLVMLSVLYANAKAVLQVQSCESSDIIKTTGLTSWQVKNAKKHLHRYTNRELVNIMKLIWECEQGIKTGRIEEQFVMNYLLVKIL